MSNDNSDEDDLLMQRAAAIAAREHYLRCTRGQHRGDAMIGNDHPSYDTQAAIIARARRIMSGPWENYQVEDSDPSGETYGTAIAGPGGFVCRLGEPEDRTWCRDGAGALQRLNVLNVLVYDLLRVIEGKVP